MNPLLETVDLCKDFRSGLIHGKQTRVLHKVNLAVDRGEIRGIVGESGCGKTTLARCCLNLIKPSSGSVYFDGSDLASLRGADLRKRRREFQMIFQNPFASLNPSMAVEDIILEPLEINGIPREERRRILGELLSAVSLDESLMKRNPAELSGGQQQRVGIARSLALKPRLLIADEPVSALDVSVQAQILNLLSDLKRRFDLTLVLISHSLAAIHYLCSRVSVMYGGRIVEESSAEAFFASPKHPYSRLLLQAASGQPTLAPNISAAAGPGEFPLRAGCIFQPHCAHSMPECSSAEPPLKEVEPGEKAACFLY